MTFRDQLREAVSNLAAPATGQVQYLRRIGTYPSADELALDFHYLVDKAESRLREIGLSSDELALIARLDEKLTKFSGQQFASEWNASALEGSQNWAQVRAIAGKVLGALV